VVDDDDVTRLRVALGRIARQLDRQTRSDSLSRAESSLLATLSRLGPMRISELADVEGVHPTMLSRMVGKLTDAGLAERAADPDDGRAALVAASDEGRELHLRLRAERSRLLAEHLAGIPDVETLMAALDALESLAESLKTRTEKR
jgi:DNA-binding MarR family transcriptional regulator